MSIDNVFTRWWEEDGNREHFKLPISVIKSGEFWVATCNDETDLILGEHLHAVAQGKTKEDAINSMMKMLRYTHEYTEECRVKYQRWVPFRKGDWNMVGGKWFVVFGLHFYFRYGKSMRHG